MLYGDRQMSCEKFIYNVIWIYGWTPLKGRGNITKKVRHLCHPERQINLENKGSRRKTLKGVY